ncbi:MAG: peptidylprolyl isomerase [Alphaproteobacteria bacterium]|nr:peptidylprolyl isomerase [Alphaproteobacteria bacterium]
MRFLLLILSIFALLPLPAQAARSEGIAAVVNQDAITMTDLNARLKLIILSSGLPNNEEIRKRLTKQIMDSLIEEQLMLQEAKRLEIAVTDEEVKQGFAQLAAQNKLQPAQFQEAIIRSGVDINTMWRQIRAQLGWTKVIQQEMRPRVNVSDADIDDFLKNLSADQGKNEYLVAEIFLPVDGPAMDADARQLSQRLVTEMRSGKVPFFKAAQQFSKAAGAAQGGDRGWLREGQIPSEMQDVLKAMKPNTISEPVKSADGYHILMLRDQRTITAENIPPRERVMSMIGVQRLERMQRRHLMDLKSSAFIENRVQS